MSKTVSLKKIMDVIDEGSVKQKKLVFQDSVNNAIEVNVRDTLSLADRKNLVSGVADMCFVNNPDGSTVYCPYLKKFAFEYHIVLFFTNINLPGEAESVCAFLNASHIINKIEECVGKEVIDGLREEVDELVNYRKSEILKHNRLDDILIGLSDLINAFQKKIEGEDGESIMKYFEENIPNFKEEMGKAFQEYQGQSVNE